MSWLDGLRHRLRTLREGERYGDEMDAEMRHHLELETVQQSASGLNPDKARAAARRRVGNVTYLGEARRLLTTLALVDRVRQDASYAVRQLRRSPAYAASTTLCLALGIWLATLMTAMVLPMYWPVLPYPSADRLVQLNEQGLVPWVAGGLSAPGVSRAVMASLRDRGLLESIGDYATDDASIEHDDDEAETRPAAILSHDAFNALGVRPILGRPFTSDDDRVGAAKVVILSNAYWLSQFGGNSTVIGSILHLTPPPDGRGDDSVGTGPGRGKSDRKVGPVATIVGVMPAGFTFPPRRSAALYLSTAGVQPGAEAQNASMLLTESEVRPGGSHTEMPVEMPVLASVIARLKPGVALDQFQAAARVIANQHLADDRAAFASQRDRWVNAGAWPNGPATVSVTPYRDAVAEDRVEAVLLACAAVLILLIACANVATLMLVRATVRRRELATRLAMGASRGRLVSQLMIESLIVIVPASVIGLLLASWYARIATSFAPSPDESLVIDPRTGAVAIAGAMVIGLAFSLLPAIRASNIRLETTLRDGHRSGLAGSRMDSLMRHLLTLSMTLTVALVVGASLIATAVYHIGFGNGGFHARGVATARLNVSSSLYPREADIPGPAADAVARVAALPDVMAAAIGPLPSALCPDQIGATTIGGRDVPRAPGYIASISGGYFRALRMPLMNGRMFTPEEVVGHDAVAIVGASTAARLWPGTNAVGRRMRVFPENDKTGTEVQIVGVAADLTLSPLCGGPTASDTTGRGAPALQIYIPIGLHPERISYVIALVHGAAGPRVTEIAKAIGSVPGVTAHEPTTLSALVDAKNASSTFTAVLLVAFGGVALVLVAVGLYGVVAFAVAQRTHEIGVRLAVGASGRAVTRLILGQGARLVAIGGGLGSALGLLLALAARALLQAVGVPSLSVFAAAIGSVAVVALVASYIPARRAARLDPITTLRTD